MPHAVEAARRYADTPKATLAQLDYLKSLEKLPTTPSMIHTNVELHKLLILHYTSLSIFGSVARL